MTEKEQVRTVVVVVVYIVHLLASAAMWVLLFPSAFAAHGGPGPAEWLTRLSFVVLFPASLLIRLGALDFGFFLLGLLFVNSALWAWVAGAIAKHVMKEPQRAAEGGK